MRARDAVKLHNGDEVTVKKDGSVATVLSVHEIYDAITKKTSVELRTYGSSEGYHIFYHDEVK